MYVFGGHIVPQISGSQEISNELFLLDLQKMTWHKLPFANQNQIKPLAYMATTVLLESQKLAIFGGLT